MKARHNFIPIDGRFHYMFHRSGLYQASPSILLLQRCNNVISSCSTWQNDNPQGLLFYGRRLQGVATALRAWCHRDDEDQKRFFTPKNYSRRMNDTKCKSECEIDSRIACVYGLYFVFDSQKCQSQQPRAKNVTPGVFFRMSRIWNRDIAPAKMTWHFIPSFVSRISVTHYIKMPPVVFWVFVNHEKYIAIIAVVKINLFSQ